MTAADDDLSAITESLGALAQLVSVQRTALQLYLSPLESFLKTNEEITAELAKLSAAVSDFESREAALLAANQTTIDALNKEIADFKAGAIDTDTLFANMQAVLDGLPVAPAAPAAVQSAQ